MSNIPADLRYTKEHEWVAVIADDVVRFGITDYAQEALGDIVFVTLPALGAELEADTPCGEVESTKSVSDVYAPLSGTVTAVNEAAETSPDSLNRDPYGAGWLAEVRVANAAAAVAGLLSSEDYEALLAG